LANAPVKTPLLSRSPTFRETRSFAAVAARYASTASRWPLVVIRSSSGCSGATTMKVAPKIVSGRVV
jgi:hypothetical protein